MKHRVRQLREAANLTQGELAKKIGVQLLTIHNIEAYKTKLSLDRLEQLAEALNVSPFELLEIDAPEIDPKTGGKKIPIVGYVGAGAEVHPIDPFTESADEIDHVLAPVTVSGDAVGLRIKGDSQFPRFLEGDVVVYGDPRSDQHSLQMMAGSEVVVQLLSGKLLLKILQFSLAPGKWNLESYNDSVMRNQEIQWAARIEAIIPRQI